MKDVKFPSFRTRTLYKGKLSTPFNRESNINTSMETQNREVKKSNIKLSWNKYINLNNLNPEKLSPSKLMKKGIRRKLKKET